MARRFSVSLEFQVVGLGLPKPETEVYFAKPRRWRFDYAWPALLLACEVEGGTFMPGGSRHSRGRGYENDCEKYAEALIRGWRVLRVTTDMVRDGRAIGYIERLFDGGERDVHE